MYAFMTLLAATVEAGLTAVARKVQSVRTRRTVRKALPQSCVDLVGQLGARGKIKPSEIFAHAAEGPEGTVTAPFSGAECVWYVVRVREKFWAWGPGPFGPQKVERSVKAVDHVSGPLVIVDHTGNVQVDPTGAEFELGEPAFSGFDAREGDGALYGRMSELLGEPLRIRHRRMTTGFLIEEWIVTEGEELRIVGRARGDRGLGSGAELVIAKARRRPLLVAKPTPAPAPL
ncbi:MAG TPA: GIDE domain-containing protein [Streptosporangiaceae bacterium]